MDVTCTKIQFNYKFVNTIHSTYIIFYPEADAIKAVGSQAK
jgi:hypothetical protein